jgi:hypothetical protein
LVEGEPAAPAPPPAITSTVLLALFQSEGTDQGEEEAEVRNMTVI